MKNNLPEGLFPVMLTPFKEDLSVDFDALSALTDWYIQTGAAGLFACCLSSEMYQLDDGEKLAVIRKVIQSAKGRPVVACGTFAETIPQQAAFCRKVADLGVQSVVALTCQLAAEHEDDNVLRQRIEQLMELTGDIPLGLYECPVPYKRLISPEMLAWAAGTGRFTYAKDTSCQGDVLKLKAQAAAGTRLGLYNAHTPLLLAGLLDGAAGISAIAANYYPELFTWMCANYRTEPDKAAKLQAVLTSFDPLIHKCYPKSAKYFLRRRGLPIDTFCRRPGDEPDKAHYQALDKLFDDVSRLLGEFKC